MSLYAPRFDHQSTPPALSAFGFGPFVYISNTTYIDGITLDDFWYTFFCTGGYACISRIYATSAYGSPFSDVIRYRWFETDAGNSCSPYSMTNGKIYPGGDSTTVVSISG
jgi:hypothetical protein